MPGPARMQWIRTAPAGALLAGALVAAGATLLDCDTAGATSYFRNATTAQTGSGATSISISRPTGVVAGDVMIAAIDAEGSEGFTVPSGWSSTGLFSGVTFFGFAGIYFKVATSSEPASYSWGLGTSRKAIGKLLDFVGVEEASPLEVTATTAGASFGTSDAASSITTTVNNTLVVVDFAADDAFGSFTITPPSGTTKRASVFTSGTGAVVGGQVQDFTQATAGATGTKTFTTSASIPWGSITIALKPGAGALVFDTAPSTPTLPTVTLKGEAQASNAKMNALAVDDTTGSGSGWNVTVAGNAAAGKSPTFKQYCSNGSEACGTSPANSYVSGGFELPAGSLQLNTSGASWSTKGGSGSTPEFKCSSTTCPLDASSTTKIVSASTSAGPWSSSGLSSTSLALSVPSTLRALPEHEVYRVDLLWTLSTGP